MVMKRLQIYLILAVSLILLGTLPSLADSKAESWSYPSSNPGLSSFDGSGTASSPYLIQKAQDLANLAYIVTDANDDVTGKYFKMTRDIYLNDFTVDANGKVTANGDLREWTPIGEWGFWRNDDFQGIFDGDGHTIYGLYITAQSDRDFIGLFGTVEDAIIKNLTIKNAYIKVGTKSTKFASTITSLGTLVGSTKNSTFSNINVTECYMYYDGTDEVYHGGLIGKVINDNTLNECSFDGNILNQVYKKGSAISGFIGCYDISGWHNYMTLRLTNCQTKGELKVAIQNDVSACIAGFLGGRINSGARYGYLTDCINSINLTISSNNNSPGIYVSNFVGPHLSYLEIRKSANLGNITAARNTKSTCNVRLSDTYATYYDCVNYGHYIFTDDNHGETEIIPGTNKIYHDSEGQNLIVWKEAKPSNLSENDTYKSEGTELGLDELNDNKILVNKLNEEVGENVWGLYDITENGKTYSVPFPISCGGTPLGLYKNEEGQYLISSETDLRTLQNFVRGGTVTNDDYYLLTHDIDMSGSAYLAQIGDESHPFTGTFDGNRHVISGLTIKGHALFGNLSGTVKRLGLVNMKFTGGNDYCAPFAYKAGASADASLLDCYAGGNITVADSTNNGTLLAGLLYEASANKVNVKNCYFRGIMANATNISSQGHFYYGLVGSNKIGTALTLSDCYAHFDFNEMFGIGAGLMPTDEASKPDITNCHYLCPYFSDATGKVTTIAELAACFSGKDGWLTGAYRPVLDNARHYELTTYDGQTVYADAIPMDDGSCRNEIYCHQLTAAMKTDPLLWALPKVAVCDADSKVNYLLNCQLYADMPFRFTPPEGSETKGELHFPLTFSSENDYAIRLMCLPATLHKSHLPEGTEVFLMGKPTGDATEGYEAYIVACDSVPAGVPFLISMNKKPTEAIDVVLRGDVVGEPQTSGTLNGQELESGLIGTFEDMQLKSGCANFEYSTTGFKVKYEENIDLKPFGAYIDADAAVSLNTGVLLKETSNYIDQTLATYKGRTVNVFLSRKLQTSGWNTLCLPFDVTEAELLDNYGDDTRLEQLTSISTDADGAFTLSFTRASSIEAGKCYLIKPEKAESYPYLFGGKTLSTDLLPTTLSSSDGSFNISFMGSFARTAIDGNDTSKGTYFTQNDKLYKVAEGRTIVMNGFRCWIETSKADVLAKVNIIHADGTTSIANVVCIGTTEDNHRIYDLQGIETTHTQPHHIYIKNGRVQLGL